MTTPSSPHYQYTHGGQTRAHDYLLPAVRRILCSELGDPNGRSLFDLGCGNGFVAAQLCEDGYNVTGVDPSPSGIRHGKNLHPDLDLFLGSAYDDLRAEFGTFEAVISLEVIEHIYSPRHFTRTLYELVEPGGVAVVSTPYHGYLKNLLLAVTGRLDNHFTALWDNGHIKFWSERTLKALLLETGFRSVRFRRVGRVPALAKSMIAIAHR